MKGRKGLQGMSKVNRAELCKVTRCCVDIPFLKCCLLVSFICYFDSDPGSGGEKTQRSWGGEFLGTAICL